MLKKIAFFAGSVLFAANLMAAEPAKAQHVLITTTNGDGGSSTSPRTRMRSWGGSSPSPRTRPVSSVTTPARIMRCTSLREP